MMNTMLPTRRWFWIIWFAAILPPNLFAQEPEPVRKIVLPSLDSQVRARLVALDKRLNPIHSPTLASAIIGQFLWPVSPLTAATPVLADPRNTDIWEQLPEEYYRLMLESGDTLVTVPDVPDVGVGWSSSQVRRLCHERLALLPRSCLESYRQRVDVEAKALLEQGRRTRSAEPLRRLVNDLFCSRVADQALDLLGDLAFEQGRFCEAQ